MQKQIVTNKKTFRMKAKRFIKRDLIAWFIMLPSIVLLCFYIWIPLLNNLVLSFYETKGMQKIDFVGFAQYLNVFKDLNFTQTLGNTFAYVFWSIIIGFFIPIVLAIILNEIVHAKGLFRAIIYLPNIIPGIAAVIVWMFLFDPNPYGVFNSIFDINSLWLDDSKLVIPLIVLTMTWKGAGATTLLYLATLQMINVSLYEAARMEGASAWQRLRYVTLPHLWSQVKTLFILQILSVFQIFYEPLVMSKGGPEGASRSLVELIYDYAFTEMNSGKAAALSVIVAIILFALSGVYFFINRDKKVKRCK